MSSEAEQARLYLRHGEPCCENCLFVDPVVEGFSQCCLAGGTWEGWLMDDDDLCEDHSYADPNDV